MTLGAWAARTSRIPLGVMVCGVGYRNVGLTVKMATALDHASGGRAILGLGAGWHEPEHRAFGYDVLSLGDRISRLDEASLLARGHARRRRRHRGRPLGQRARTCATTRPRSRRTCRLLIGGSGEKRTLRIVARDADIWNGEGDPRDLRPQERRARRALCRRRSRSTLDPADRGHPADLHPGVAGRSRRRPGRDPGQAGRRRRRPGRGPRARPSPTPRRRSSASCAAGTRPAPRRSSSTCRRPSTTRRSNAWPVPSGPAWPDSLPLRPTQGGLNLMRAAVYEGEGRLVVKDVPDPVPGRRRGPDRGRGLRRVRVGRPDHQHPARPSVDAAGDHRPRVRGPDPGGRIGGPRPRRRQPGRLRSRSEVRGMRLLSGRPAGQLHEHRGARGLSRRCPGAST